MTLRANKLAHEEVLATLWSPPMSALAYSVKKLAWRGLRAVARKNRPNRKPHSRRSLVGQGIDNPVNDVANPRKEFFNIGPKRSVQLLDHPDRLHQDSLRS